MSANHSELAARTCAANTSKLGEPQIQSFLPKVAGWEINNGELARTFQFKNYYETMAFVNGVAWIAHHADHHPDLAVGYNKCTVRYSTHSVGGLSENDFICAAKINALMTL